MSPPPLEFNYDISCPFAYIASTRISSLSTRTNTPINYRPVLLGAIYRSTSAPQGAAGSASDVFNPTKKAVAGQSMSRTLKRYKIAYNPPPEHPRKSVDALRLLYCVPDGEERRVLSEAFFRGYWAERKDVSDRKVLLEIARETGIKSASTLSLASFDDQNARRGLEENTAKAISRGAFGVPGFWLPNAPWTDVHGEERVGRYFWGQDRMHFVEATLLSGSANQDAWSKVRGLNGLMPRCIPLPGSSPSTSLARTGGAKTKLEFWYDFSSPWAFLGYTQLARIQRLFPALEIVMKPFLLAILFREIGAPNLPMAAVSKAKAVWSRQDHADWTNYWNAVNEQEGRKDKEIEFVWAGKFPIRTPTVLRVAIAEPKTVPVLYAACWEKNADVSDEDVLSDILTKAGYNGPDLVRRANEQAIKTQLREATAEAKALGICGVPTYRVMREDSAGHWSLVGGLVWGQDETNVVEDLVAGWEPERSEALAEPRKGENAMCAKL